MLYSFLSWKVVKLSLLISIILSFLFLFVQLVQIDQVLFKTPFIESLSFLGLWFLYFVSYFLPSSFFVSSSWLIFELKESKKLSILASFGIDPKVLFFKLFLVSSPLLFSVLFVGYFIRQEDVSYMRKLFVYKYYTEVVKTIPEKSFYTFGGITIRIEKREGDLLKDVFLKIDDFSVSAGHAQFKGDKLILKDGSLVFKKDDKYYLTKFRTYELTLSKLFVPEKKKREAYLLQAMNVVFAVLFAFSLFQIILRWINKHTKLYYTLGLILLIHHITLILLKTMLS
ncbi:MAG: LptF/LptG family permease [Thermocrinis sp.]|jgi:lipopolysaccharide export LptBFGC system permease protein LptF|nr:LptF/LptG family permease [Thermocrinis sp.]